MALRTNFTPLDSTLRYNLRMLEGNEWVYISSDNNSELTKLETTEESNDGVITFDGYWYTKGFREQLEKHYTEDEILPFTETFETPVKMQLSYSKWASEHTEVKKVKESSMFPGRLQKEGEEDKEMNQYTFPLLEGIEAEIEVYKREVFEDTSGEGFEDEDYGRIILTPTYMNKLWFRFVNIEWSKGV